tara:strand:+ start:1409 stop:1675 length:267 start_codon:yes stop_codon:yes gene_type:complete
MIEYILKATSRGWETKSSIENKKKSAKFERLHIKIDDQIKYCVPCKLTWKKNRKMYHRDYEYFPKNHIPIMGKEKLNCPKCQKENKNG